MNMYKKTLVLTALVLLVIIGVNLTYIPIVSGQSTSNDVAMYLKYHADFDRRTEMIDSYLVNVVKYYKLRNHYLALGDQVKASKYGGMGDALLSKTIDQIYKYHKDDVKAILKDLLEMDILLYRVASTNKNLAIQMLIKAGYTDESAVQMVNLSLTYKGNIEQVRKGYNLIVNNEYYLKSFIGYMVYEDVKNMLIESQNPSTIHFQEITPTKMNKGGTKYIGPDAVSFPGLNVHFVQLKAEMQYSKSGTDCGFHPFEVNVNDPLNTLYKVIVYDYNSYSSSNKWYYYVLEFWFGDEDHPIPAINAIYDSYRQSHYGRIQDVEEVAIYGYVSSSIIIWTIDFSYGDIWSEGHAYAYPIGVHGNAKKTVSGSVIIYVSDVWNHAMDTINHNACGKTPYREVYPKIDWRFSVS